MSATACGSPAPSPAPSPTTTLASDPSLAESSPPFRLDDRAPLYEPPNPANDIPPVGNDALSPEFYENFADFDLVADFALVRDQTRDAAHAFAGSVIFNARDPRPSSLNLSVPGHPRPFALPAQVDAFVRAAAFLRRGVVGADVGPTRPDAAGRVWLAVFQGAGGPLGAVASVCVGVTLRSDGRDVHVEFPEVPSEVFRQPLTADDIPGVRCQVDLDLVAVPWTAPAA